MVYFPLVFIDYFLDRPCEVTENAKVDEDGYQHKGYLWRIAGSDISITAGDCCHNWEIEGIYVPDIPGPNLDDIHALSDLGVGQP